tara:strand:- start:312 stop:662 length:351 start_codon:yes stop_codon:yes gene_type:complete
MENLRDYREFKELEKVVKQISFNVLQIQQDLRDFVTKQQEINTELQQQIDLRPVSMNHMRDELFDDVSKQVEWRLSQKVSEFDGVVNKFFANARFSPNEKVSDQFDTKFELDKEVN